MTEDNVMAPFMASKYSEIADMVIRDVVVRAYLEAQIVEFEQAMRHLRPYMQRNPSLTVAQALEVMRVDKATTNQQQAAPVAGRNLKSES